MNIKNLLSALPFFRNRHVSQGDSIAPPVNFQPPTRLFSFSNPLEYSHELSQFSQYTSKDFYGSLGAQISTYMIDNTPVIASCIENITSSIAEADWRLENDETPESTMLLFEELLERIDFVNKVRDIASFVPYGWVALEIVFDKPKDGIPFPIVELATIRQESLEHWVADKNGKIIGLKQKNKEHAIPLQKLVLFRDTPNRGNAEGRGILRSCFSSFKILEELKRIHIEQQKCASANFVKASIPMSILHLSRGSEDGGANDVYQDKDVKAAKAMCDNLASTVEGLSRGKATSSILASDLQIIVTDDGEKLTTAKQYDIEVQPLSNKDVTILQDIKHYEQQIIMGMSMEHRLIGSGETGSKSSGEVHKSTSETLLSSYCKIISSVMRSQLFKTFAALNGIKEEHIPVLIASDIDKSNINFKINASQAVIHASEKGFPEIARSIARDANLPEDDIRDVDEMELEDEVSFEPDLNIQRPGQQIKQE